MSIHNLSSNNWIRIDETLDDIIRKIKSSNRSEEDKDILLKKINKNISEEYHDLFGYGNYTNETPAVVIPKLFNEHFNNKIKPIVNNLSEGNLSIIKKIYSEVKILHNNIKNSKNTINKLKNKSKEKNLTNFFKEESDKLTYENPLNDFIKDWTYDEKLDKNIFESTYSFIYRGYLKGSSEEERVNILGCEKNTDKTDDCKGNALYSDPAYTGKRLLINPNTGKCEQYKNEKYYKCPNLIKRIDPLTTSRSIDLTIPAMGTLYNNDEKKNSISGFIQGIFFEDTSSFNLRDYFHDFPIDLNIDIDNELKDRYVYLNLDMTNCGDVEQVTKNRMSVKNEVIQLSQNDDAKDMNGNHLFIPGNLFKIFKDDVENEKGILTSEIKQAIDKIYKSPNNEKKLKETKLKLKKSTQDVSIEEIKNAIIILYSIYIGEGLDYELVHKNDHADEINRRVAKELLYLALFTFYNYLEHNVVKKIQEELKSKSLDQSIKKNVNKYFNNLLSLLRTNTVYLLGYDKTKIDFKNNYGILSGQTDNIWSEKGGNFHRLEDGYKNSKIPSNEEIQEFKKHFPLKIKNSENNKDIVFALTEKSIDPRTSSSNKKRELFFTKNNNNETIDNKNQSDGTKDIKINDDDDLYFHNVDNFDASNELHKNLKARFNVKIISKNNLAIAKNPNSTNKGDFNKFNIDGGEILQKSFLVFKEDEYLNMANFIIGTTKSFEDIKTKEKIGFGILPYRKDENLLDSEKRNKFLLEVYVQYLMNVTFHVEKNEIYLGHIKWLLANYLHKDFVEKWYDEFNSELDEIYSRPLQDAGKAIFDFKEIIETEIGSLLRKLKENTEKFIENDYKDKIEKDRSELSEEYLINLLMARNKYLLYKKTLISTIKKFKQDKIGTGISENYVEEHLHEDKILDIFNRISKGYIAGLAKELEENDELQLKALEIGEKIGRNDHILPDKLFHKILKESFDISSYTTDINERTELLDKEAKILKLAAIKPRPGKIYEHCALGTSVLPRTEIIKFWLGMQNKRSSFIPITNPTNYAISYERTIWPRIFDNIGLNINKDNIMIPVLKGIDYVLLDLKKYLEPVSSIGGYIKRDLDKCFQRKGLSQKSKMKNYRHIILVTYDVKDTTKRSKWRVLPYNELKRVENTSTENRYNFVFNLLTNKMKYEQYLNTIWNNGSIKDAIPKKTPNYIVSFDCLSSKIYYICSIIS
jgi:hypothetical protein